MEQLAGDDEIVPMDGRSNSASDFSCGSPGGGTGPGVPFATFGEFYDRAAVESGSAILWTTEFQWRTG